MTVTQASFKEQVVNSSVPVLVDFWAPWCGPCLQMTPVLQQLADEFDGKAVIAKVNVDDERALAAMFQIMSIPALMFFKDGKQVSKSVGAQPKAALQKTLQSLIDE